jgi:hypothetical protein
VTLSCRATASVILHGKTAKEENVLGSIEMLICLSPIALLAAIGAMLLVVRFQKH